jgi:hypothetical protein
VNSRLIVLLIVGVPVVVGAYLAGPVVWDMQMHRRPPDRILIPAGFTGWARVDFGVKGTPPLPREQRYTLIVLNSDGLLKTSSLHPEGLGKDEYFYVSPSGRALLSTSGVCKGGMIWGVATGIEPGHDAASVSEKFFVGTETQFRHEVDPAGKNFSPCE